PGRGMDEPRCSVGLELATQVADVNLEGVRRGRKVVAPDFLKDLATFEHLPRMTHQQFKEMKFSTGQRNRPDTPPDLAGAEVEHQVGEFQLLTGIAARRAAS